MAASDLNDLNNFEVHFESAAVTFLNSDVGISVVGTVNETTLIAPRIDVEFRCETANDPYAPRNGGGSPTTEDYRSFTGEFTARLVTDNATGGSGDHATYRSKIRTSLMRSGANWTGGSGSSSTLSGTGSITEGESTVTGSGTAFTTELSSGASLTLGGQTFIVSSISSDTSLTTTSAATATVSGAALGEAASNLEYYDVKLLKPTSATYEANGDMNVTELSYEVIFEIRDDAWP